MVGICSVLIIRGKLVGFSLQNTTKTDKEGREAFSYLLKSYINCTIARGENIAIPDLHIGGGVLIIKV